MSSERLNGKVKWFSAARGYGFITGADGKDLFVHYSQIQMNGYKTLDADQEVTYEVGEGPKNRKQANVVQIVGDQPKA